MRTFLIATLLVIFGIGVMAADDSSKSSEFMNYSLKHSSSPSPELQAAFEKIHRELRIELGIEDTQAAAGLIDLKRLQLAMIHPDRGEYAASVPKIAILLAYFELESRATESLDKDTRHKLGLMAKASSNEAASEFSRRLGLKRIQEVLQQHGFYDVEQGGGIWMGKHYGQGGERFGDPLHDHSHAATVRQLLRFFLLLEQGKLISAEASRAMREIFESPEIPHDQIKFVKGLEGRSVEIIRKWGTWQDWRHDAAVIKGQGRHYILVGLTRHPRGDEYLERLAAKVDDLMQVRTK